MQKPMFMGLPRYTSSAAMTPMAAPAHTMTNLSFFSLTIPPVEMANKKFGTHIFC